MTLRIREIELELGPRRGWVVINAEQRTLLEEWAMLMGVPEEKIERAMDQSLVRAYNDRTENYIKNWIVGNHGRRKSYKMPRLTYEQQEKLAQTVRERYLPNKRGYVEGTTDKQIARELGQPYSGAHVARMRRDLFGTRWEQSRGKKPQPPATSNVVSLKEQALSTKDRIGTLRDKIAAAERKVASL